MSKVKVKSRFEINQLLGPEFGPEFQRQMGELIVKEIKNDLSKGNSPVRGERRFDPYKDKEKYPGDLKPSRPVNLELTGEMLANLTSKVVSGRSAVDVGFMNASEDVKKRAELHNKGGNGVPRRKFLPWEDGDELNVRITRAMIDLYKARLARLLKKSNN